MHTPFAPPVPRFIRRRAGSHRVVLLVAMIACLAVVAAGCGGGSEASSVAHLGTSTAPTKTETAAVSGSRSPVAYARCMRSHGVPMFPDPDSNGHLSSSSIPNLNSPQYRKAQEVCRSLLPQGYTGQGGSPTGGSLTPQQQAQFLKYARCMRTHGLPNFPDPTSSGLTLSGIDPNSPRFQAAQKACRSLLPNRGKGNFQSVGGGRGKP
jgi:hypothetical protein